jgi:hypothetical protein
MDVVEAASQPSSVAVERATGQPGRAGAPVPRHHPVVQREPKRRQLLVVDRERWQAFERVPQVVPEKAANPPANGGAPSDRLCH